MNEIIESLYHRKSMRVFEEKAIPDELKGEILQAALQAPSAGCQQLYTILDIMTMMRMRARQRSMASARSYTTGDLHST